VAAVPILALTIAVLALAVTVLTLTVAATGDSDPYPAYHQGAGQQR
jgi:hypothetical protein